jgi:hypothetical protein
VLAADRAGAAAKLKKQTVSGKSWLRGVVRLFLPDFWGREEQKGRKLFVGLVKEKS